jgi:capsular exopolysaccharide synthesis family protein
VKANEQEVVEAFHADPHVAELDTELRKAKSRYQQATRTTRLASDPSVRSQARRVNDLESEIGRLWQQLRPAIVARLSGADDDGALVQAETEVRALKAKEAALRKQREQARSDRLRQLRLEYDQCVARSTPDPAKLKTLKDQIARLDGSTPEAMANPGHPQTRALLGAIERGLKSVEAVRAEIEERFQNDLAASRKTEIDMLTESNLRNNLERQRMLFNSVVDQLKQAQLVSDYGSVTAQVINPPIATEKRASMATALSAAVVLGFGLGGAIAFIADLLDARVRSVSEIRRVLDLRLLGVIPELGRQQLENDVMPGLISHTTPRSLLAESCKAIRTTLDLVRRHHDARVLLITSGQSGEGKSTAASNLAISLAHAGRRVLLIDADLRRPTQHLIHGLPRSPGLVHVLKGMHPCHRVVRQTPIDNLDLVAAGPDVANPAELLSSPHLASLVAELRQQYDVVVFDSSPLLAVTDAAIIASVVDAVTLIVRVSVTRRHDLERTAELLATLGTPVLGTVVNGLVPEQFGCGYGYTYGYTYGSYVSRAPTEGGPTHQPQTELTVACCEPPAFGIASGSTERSPSGAP